jgi:hypothetical protein
MRTRREVLFGGLAVAGLWALPIEAAGLGEYGQVLARRVRSGGVDYAAIQLGGELSGFLAALAAAVEPTSRAGRMAFWINAYNGLTLHLVASHWPLQSIRDLDGGEPWKKRRFVVAGRERTLDEIEHQILRPLADPRVHGALVCAARGCPPLLNRPFGEAALSADLDAACASWARTTALRLDATTRVVQLNRIFDWYSADFPEGPAISGANVAQSRALHFLRPYLDSAVGTQLAQGGWSVRWADYDWSVNSAP